MRADILAVDGLWHSAEFLIDTGADRTVLSANVWVSLDLETHQPDEQIGGLGGLVDAVIVETQLRMTRETGVKVTFCGRYMAYIEQEILDMSVLGRDILDMFAVIIDRPDDTVCLIREQHKYNIIQI